MPWFYYSGPTPKSMPVKKGVSVAVRPHSRVEIFEPGVREIQALQKKGVLRRTGPPPRSERPVQGVVTTSADIKAVTPKSDMAKKIAEKGVTTDKGQAPKKPAGAPEMTEGELTVAAQEKAERDSPKKDSESDSVVVSDSPPSGVDVVEALSKADGSPDENPGGGENSKKKKKKKRHK